MTGPGSTPRIIAVIPAAGRSRRMGVPKQTLPVADSTMLGTVVSSVLSAGVDNVVVVTTSELRDKLGLPHDPRLSIAINDDLNSEMIDSIRIGLAEAARFIGSRAREGDSKDGILVVPGDMPALAADTCRDCMDLFRHDPTRVIVATYQGRRGHPMIFPLCLRPDVDAIEGGLNELLKQHAERLRPLETADPGVVRDIDTLEHYYDL